MTFSKIGIPILSALTLLSCGEKEKQTMTIPSKNTILAEWNTPFGVPPFDLIKNEDYKPAFLEAIKIQNAEIESIVSSSEKANFNNTIVAFENSGSGLKRVQKLFFAVNGANTNDVLKSVSKFIAPKLSEHSDGILLNEGLFSRIKNVYDNQNSMKLSDEDKMLLKKTYDNFVRAGVGLKGADKTRLKAINAELASLSETFSSHLLDETNDFEFHTKNKEDLGNLPKSLVALAQEEALKKGHKDGWSFTLQRPSINPFLQSSPNKDARKLLFDAYAKRANRNNEKDNNAIILSLVNLRLEKANLLGFKSHADYVLDNSMAENPKAVYDFMDKLWKPALTMAKGERLAMKESMKEGGEDSTLFVDSDWRYYVEKVRKKRYNFDEEQTRPYFEFTAVRNGVFSLATKLFGLTFTERKDIPKWHKDQQVFEVLEKDGQHLGLIYMDFFARESKRGGAWMNDLRSQSNQSKFVTPIVTNNFNYPAPTKDNPSLLSFSEAQTLFHEFGHALHGLFSQVKYESLSGTNVPRDFVEFPSQVMENWMSEPEVLKLFAKHYITGEVIPNKMIEKMNKANAFNGGFGTVEYMAAAYLDLAWHSIETKNTDAVNSFEKNVFTNLELIEEIIPRYRSTYFSHVFSGGYSSGYYSYLWSEVLDADCFEAFKETGNLFDQKTAVKFRTMLSKGGSMPGMDLYKNFRGKSPDIKPLLNKKGFLI